jgi:hypothetical protein
MLHDDQHFHEQEPADTQELEPIVCELANGHDIKIQAQLWSRWRTYEEWVSGIKPEPYFAIRVYCTENSLPKRMVWVEEYCAESDFPKDYFDEIWQWLINLCGGREIFDFDDLDEFLDHLSDAILQFTMLESDAVEHFKHLPEISKPEDFDKVDDSDFNDQNENENNS